MLYPDAGCHLNSGRSLFWRPADRPPTGAGLDAIIVPTVRGFASLAGPATLAKSLNCPLVTLHSGRRPQRAPAGAIGRLLNDIDTIAIDVTKPGNDALRPPQTETSRILRNTKFARAEDTSTKRNIGLILSRMLGWQRVLFLDDDIQVGNPDDVRAAANLLDSYDTVGLALGGFPDHSVVCHAYREAGGRHQSFVGGGALAVEVARCSSFFPDVYNEDWLFLLDEEKGMPPLGVTGLALQRPYDPFRTPDRARSEQFGDVLAGGIFWLLDRGYTFADANALHWAEFLVRRREFIEHILRALQETAIEPRRKAGMTAALNAALVQLTRISPELCCDYLKAWAFDRAEWRRHIECLPASSFLSSQNGGKVTSPLCRENSFSILNSEPPKALLITEHDEEVAGPMIPGEVAEIPGLERPSKFARGAFMAPICGASMAEGADGRRFSHRSEIFPASHLAKSLETPSYA
jgi:hypothetical protein